MATSASLAQPSPKYSLIQSSTTCFSGAIARRMVIPCDSIWDMISLESGSSYNLTNISGITASPHCNVSIIFPDQNGNPCRKATYRGKSRQRQPTQGGEATFLKVCDR